jgi:hypothetical protein
MSVSFDEMERQLRRKLEAGGGVLLLVLPTGTIVVELTGDGAPTDNGPVSTLAGGAGALKQQLTKTLTGCLWALMSEAELAEARRRMGKAG